jgi:F0F1-type ATP synthase assembly protein I
VNLCGECLKEEKNMESEQKIALVVCVIIGGVAGWFLGSITLSHGGMGMIVGMIIGGLASQR